MICAMGGRVALFRPPLDRHWKVSGGRWVSAQREYVLDDNDWTEWAPAWQVFEVPGDHDSMVLEPNVRVLAARLRRCDRGGQSRPAPPARRGGGVSAMTGPTLLTVILNWRTPEMTLRAAEAALRAMEGIAGALTIVDNDSGDGSFEMLSEAVAARGWGADRVRVLQSGRNGGFGAGNNFGIRAGTCRGGGARLVYLLNSDAFPEPDAIRSLLDHLEANPGTGLAGSYIHGPDGDAASDRVPLPLDPGRVRGGGPVRPDQPAAGAHVVALPVPESMPRWTGWPAPA
jgi:hypothetical protein